ncbi:MAG: formate dehydrogenase accessory sulfurtransferase FdhD [Bacteroidia bacterium]|nr:formate dehydrogenase accessory sulfurtransferase FdhD [Bacteroidia bacterium]
MNMKHQVNNIQVIKISPEGVLNKPDLLAVEEPLEIRLGFGSLSDRQQKSLSITMRTPGHDFELALGFLFTEGIIRSLEQVESIKYCNSVKQEEIDNVVRVELNPEILIDINKFQRHFYTSSSCGVCGKTSIDSLKLNCNSIDDGPEILAEVIYSLPGRIRNSQNVFEHTGGLHAAALFNHTGEQIILREDVGRHNALDKVIGAMLVKKNIPFSDSILMLSGRVSFELVQKAAVAGIPIIAAVGAPSSLAVNLAKETGITLLGFVRGRNFNIYCGEQRIVR